MTNILRKTLLAGLALPLLFTAATAGEVTLLFWPGPESEAMQKVLDACPSPTRMSTIDGETLYRRLGFGDARLLLQRPPED